MMSETELLELSNFLTMAHHIPGRLRLKLDPAIKQHPAAALLENMARNTPNTGMLGMRLNVLARSLVIEYDPERIPPEEITNFLTATDQDAARRSIATIAGLFGFTLAAHKENRI